MYKLVHRSYGLFSKDMQKHMKSMSVPWRQTVRNGHIIACKFILLTSNEDKKILYTQANQLI